ncbi:MAG: hypothetical protein VKJ86_00820 [Synechococcus sp.]|nr:hypothetical protein [Synechococcus sp.]
MTPDIFRQRYPHGGLISELAAIEHGQFIVRVVVEIEGKQLASGLAAAPSVEQAEDQARIRALNLLGSMAIVPQPQLTQPSQVAAPVVPSSASGPPKPSSPPAPVPMPPTPAPAAVIQEQEAVSLPAQTTLMEPASRDEELAPMASTDFGPVEAMDFSEIIARSDVELKRLGWSSEQGRTYLLETYGKRSRQLLSDTELLEFLQYLEAQPSPSV